MEQVAFVRCSVHKNHGITPWNARWRLACVWVLEKEEIVDEHIMCRDDRETKGRRRERRRGREPNAQACHSRSSPPPARPSPRFWPPSFSPIPATRRCRGTCQPSNASHRSRPHSSCGNRQAPGQHGLGPNEVAGIEEEDDDALPLLPNLESTTMATKAFPSICTWILGRIKSVNASQDGDQGTLKRSGRRLLRRERSTSN